MKKKILIGSIIAVAIIVLSSFTSVVGKVSSDNELVEFDVEFSGLGQKHTVSLTHQEADEVDQLFTDIEQQLSMVETTEEAEEIFKDAIVELDRYDLLGGMSIKQAESLIFEKFQTAHPLKPISPIYPRSSPMLDGEEVHSAFCLVIGQSTPTFSTLINTILRLVWLAIFSVPVIVVTFLLLAYIKYGNVHLPLFEILAAAVLAFSEKSNQFFHHISTLPGVYPFANIWLQGDRGWIQTIGVVGGSQSINGTLWGNIDPGFSAWAPAVVGFTGLNIRVNSSSPESDLFYIGSAVLVKVSHRPR